MLTQHGQFVEDEDAEDGTDDQKEAVERWAPARPGQERGRAQSQETDELKQQPEIGEQESYADHEQDLWQSVHIQDLTPFYDGGSVRTSKRRAGAVSR